MEAAFITPFIKSIQNVFSMMLQLDVTVGDPHLRTEKTGTFDVSAIIGLSGDVVGSVVMGFPVGTAERIVALFTGEEATVDHPDFTDAIGELINMISGNAKADFTSSEVSISCPSVVIGKDHQIGRLKEVHCVIVPCSTDCGDLVLEISIQDATASSVRQDLSNTAVGRP